MKISSFFIDRPIFATVLAVVIFMVGLVALPILPISEYPDVVPPTIVVSGQFPGASAKTVAETVLSPLEQQINGVEHSQYVQSSAQSDGTYSITVTFELGTNLDSAQVQVQNRVQQALPRLPDAVQKIGVVTEKSSPDITLVFFISSTDARYDTLYLRNYAVIHIRDQLARLKGMGQVRVIGAGDYAMRIWLNPNAMASRSLTVDEVLAAVRAQNIEVSSGVIGGQPAAPGMDFQYTVNAKGRLNSEEDFEGIVVKVGQNGDVTYLKDIARIELGGESYGLRASISGNPAAAIPIYQLPGANALEVAKEAHEMMDQLSKEFPEGMTYETPYDPTIFIRSSIKAVIETLFESVILVVLVVLVFLQTWRASIIPLIAVPVAIVGTLAALLMLGYTINALTLFGLVLATGIVVDDAIVVVENIERKIEGGLAPVPAAHAAMAEVARPIISIMLALCAVFVPAAFISGLAGQFYKQFAVTIAAATVISTFNSLTLSPALAAVLLKPHGALPDGVQLAINRVFGGFFRLFNRLFERGSTTYSRGVSKVTARRGVMIVGFAVLLGCTYWMFKIVPSGFIPSQDKELLVSFANLPNASSLDRSAAVGRKILQAANSTPGLDPYPGCFTGMSINGQVTASNSVVCYLPETPFEERRTKEMSGPAIASRMNQKLSAINEAFAVAVQMPPILGLGTTGGFKLYLEDRSGQGYGALAKTSSEFVDALRKRKEINPFATYGTYQNDVPQLKADVDRVKAMRAGVPLSGVFDALQVFVGSVYVNDINKFGRVFRVFAQADAPYRMRPEDIGLMHTRNNRGEMVPLSSFVNIQQDNGPDRVNHYNVYLAAEIDGEPAPGYSSGQAIKAVEEVAASVLPQSMGFEWTELTYQEKIAGNTALIVFPLSVFLVFLILAAQYESWALPLAVILIVPMSLLTSLVGVWLKGSDNNIFTQIGFIVLIGLACKNAILIVEFARERYLAGQSIIQAAVEACGLRVRPILMTSCAFIMGVLPLVFATGAGAEMRQAMGVAVFSGMLGVTFFGLFLTPVFFVTIESIRERKSKRSDQFLDKVPSGEGALREVPSRARIAKPRIKLE
jgi:multidrug efflux pump